jgi:hypothetical protein
MVSYSVIMGSALMTVLQPSMIIFRTCESEIWILEVPSRGLLVDTWPMVCARLFAGGGWAIREVSWTGQREIAQPLAWEWLSRIVE